jgi:hypothetical protein
LELFRLLCCKARIFNLFFFSILCCISRQEYDQSIIFLHFSVFIFYQIRELFSKNQKVVIGATFVAKKIKKNFDSASHNFCIYGKQRIVIPFDTIFNISQAFFYYYFKPRFSAKLYSQSRAYFCNHTSKLSKLINGCNIEDFCFFF